MSSLRRNRSFYGAWISCAGLVALFACSGQETAEDPQSPDASNEAASPSADESPSDPTPSELPSDQPSSSNDEQPNTPKDDDKDPSADSPKDDESPDPSGEEAPKDPMPWFTFFTTSQEGLVSLSDDKVNGFGGDLGGLEGADEICKKLALRGNPGDQKTWRAFLSAHEGKDGQPVNAIDRIGNGPWHDFNNRLLAANKEELLPGQDRRPAGAEPQLAEMFTDELGQPISPNINVVDNHDMLTGSDKNGRLPENSTPAETCNDWTSKRTDLGKPRIGHAWPRSRSSGREWIYDHRAGGCGAGIDTEKKKGNGTPTVGSGGGYGGIYCFALSK